MGQLVKLVESLELKIEKLLESRQRCKEQVVQLEDDLRKEQAQVNELKDRIEVLVKKNQTLKSANALLGSNDYKRETKLKINALIREIDHCIVELSE